MDEIQRLSFALGVLQQVFQGALEQAKKRNYEVMSDSDKRSALRAELKEKKIADYFFVEEVFSDYIVVYAENYGEGGKSKYLKIPYAINDNVAMFGSPVEVERVTTFLPVEEVAEDGQKQAKEQQEVVEYQELTQAEPMQLLLSDLSYLQFEEQSLEQAKKDPSQGLRFKNAVLTTFEVKNSQKQWYPKKVWENNLKQLQDRAADNQLVGEADHPSGKPSIARQCVKFEEIWIEGNQVKGSGKILNNSLGRDIIAQASEGIPIPLSSRGYGTVKLENVQGETLPVIQDDFYCVTFDAVWAPSAPGSYITEFKQSQKDGPVELNQSKKEGETQTMDKFLQEILKLKGQIEFLKEQGVDISDLENQLAALEQVNTAAMNESEAMAILAPFRTALKAKGLFPADPSANKEVHNMTRKQAEEPKPELTQEVKPEVKEVSPEHKKQRDDVLAKLTQDYDDTAKIIFQSMMENKLTVSDVVTSFEEVKQSVHKVLGISTNSGAFYVPNGVGQLEHEKRYQKAPKTAKEAISYLSQGLDDLTDPQTGLRVLDANNMKHQFELFAQNMATVCPHIMRHYLLWEQGRLEQAGEGVQADLAATYATLLPIIRRTWSKLILPVIASIQVIDRPTGQISYLEYYNEEGANLADYHYYTYSDNDTEYADAKKVKFKITNETISATSKKLKAVMSYEEIQDARAYYNFDAMSRAMEIVAGQIAREYNNQGLFDLMTASGTAGNTDFGKNAPTEYDQKDWEAQGLKVYLSKVSGDISKYRQEGMTTIVGGNSALLQLEKLGSAYGFIANHDQKASEVYAGVNIFGTINGKYTVYEAPIFEESWAKDKLLCLRRGTDFTDSPYVFAPFTIDIEPPKHGVDGDFSVSQGIMSRAAKKVVSPRSIATLTFKDETGVRL